MTELTSSKTKTCLSGLWKAALSKAQENWRWNSRVQDMLERGMHEEVVGAFFSIIVVNSITSQLGVCLQEVDWLVAAAAAKHVPEVAGHAADEVVRPVERRGGNGLKQKHIKKRRKNPGKLLPLPK